jgi:uncharacterized protein YbbC (DUF1343 family)
MLQIIMIIVSRLVPRCFAFSVGHVAIFFNLLYAFGCNVLAPSSSFLVNVVCFQHFKAKWFLGLQNPNLCPAMLS